MGHEWAWERGWVDAGAGNQKSALWKGEREIVCACAVECIDHVFV